MKPDLLDTHLPINWENGMMMSAAHLIGQNKFIIGAAYNPTLIHINPVNYGLLACYDGQPNSLEIRGDQPREYFKVELVRCMAVMASGHIIAINPETVAAGKYEKSDLILEINLGESREAFLVVYLETDAEWSPVGQPDTGEDFDRKPYLNITAKLKYTTLNSPDEITNRYRNSHNVMPLSLYDIGDKAHIKEITKFIPPSVSFDSCKPLARFYEQLQKRSDELLSSCTEVLKFVHEDSQKNLRSDIAIDMGVIIKPIINSLIDINSHFKTSLRYENPIRLVQLFKKMAIAMRAAYFSLNQTRRRELGRYFSEFHGTPSDFMEIASVLESAEYSHVNIYHSCLKKILKFLKVYSELFSEMAQKGLKTEELVGGGYEEDVQDKPENGNKPPPISPKSQEEDFWDM